MYTIPCTQYMHPLQAMLKISCAVLPLPASSAITYICTQWYLAGMSATVFAKTVPRRGSIKGLHGAPKHVRTRNVQSTHSEY